MDEPLVKRMKFALSAVSLTWLGMAHAQSSVTFYGIVDAGLQYASKVAGASGGNAGKTFSFTNGGFSPSLYGFRGSEDLGGGLAANFDLESGISLANGGYGTSNGNFWGRRAWVGISGHLGEMRFGEQASPFFFTLFDADPRGFSTFASSLVFFADNIAFTGGVNSNAITYLSPKVAGFQGSVMFAPGGVAGNFQAGQQWSANAKYDNGTLMVNAALYHGNGGGARTPVPTTIQFDGRTLSAAYRLDGLILKASFENYNVAGSFNEYIYGVGANYHLNQSVSFNGGVWFSTDHNDKANHSLLAGLGTIYQLSKRTALYAQVGMVSNHGKMNTGLSVTDPAIMKGVPDATTFGANLGIQHTF